MLRGLSLARNRPWIIVLEVALPGTTVRTNHNFLDYLTSFQYKKVYNDGINDFYLAAEHNYLEKNFSTPINISDGPWFTSSTGLRDKVLDQELQIKNLTVRLKELDELITFRERYILRYLSKVVVSKMQFYVEYLRKK